jgi:hypothetical protein
MQLASSERRVDEDKGNVCVGKDDVDKDKRHVEDLRNGYYLCIRAMGTWHIELVTFLISKSMFIFIRISFT